MKLAKLLKKIPSIKFSIINNHHINSLCDESQNVKENDLFFAVGGHRTDGKKYIEEAIRLGAKSIIYQGDVIKDNPDINYINVKDVKKMRAKMAKIFYHDLTKKIKMIGITGTNGKTTTSTILADFLNYTGDETLLIGTNGIFFKDQHFYTENTTPSLLMLYDVIYQSYLKGARYVVMEVSSIGIRELRVMYFDFDIIIMTNFSQDHLDYHENLTDYKFSKSIIMSNMPDTKDKVVILNIDCPMFSFYNAMCLCDVKTYGIKYQADFQAQNIIKNLSETQFRLLCNNQKYQVKSSLIGGFNIYNILAVIACLDHLDIKVENFIEFLKIYVNVAGRMDIIKYDNRNIVIDFAHTPASVDNVLKNLKDYENKRLCVIMGCGGNRDKSKRAIMGEIVAQYADKIIFTNDNPRDETPEEIIDDITSRIKNKDYEIILDRKKAIIQALEDSIPGEIIAILGKGSERHQIIQGIKYPFNDKEIVKNYLRRTTNEI